MVSFYFFSPHSNTIGTAVEQKGNSPKNSSMGRWILGIILTALISSATTGIAVYINLGNTCNHPAEQQHENNNLPKDEEHHNSDVHYHYIVEVEAPEVKLPYKATINQPNTNYRREPRRGSDSHGQLTFLEEVTVIQKSSTKERIGEIEDFWYEIYRANDSTSGNDSPLSGWVFAPFLTQQ